MELSKKIYQLRKLSGMTQEQLAEKLNISRQTLSKWENGTSIPDVESVVRLSVLFNTSLEELLLEEENHVEEEKTQNHITEYNTLWTDFVNRLKCFYNLYMYNGK